jgi:multifunctional 2-oxoglutarate metabolism enzyme
VTPRSPGKGVVVETLNLSQLRGYRTGGTIHVVINNQVGFTTAPAGIAVVVLCHRCCQDPSMRRSCTSTVMTPRHVVRVARLAFAFRQTFHRDIVIDMVCYRRHGHNEGDDPSFTQPQMYANISRHRSVRKLYTERLMRRGDISIEQAEAFLKDFEVAP